ncbi:MAG TPA: glutathionylspermidine synthase family protein [Holophaga sp.]|nr:glutathionylspermidine synthase family protein [Holophaga sp.]
MRRMRLEPRPDWKARLEALGVNYHTHDDGSPYWREDACYGFSLPEVERLERAAQDVQAMCLKAVDHILARNRFAEYGIPPQLIPAIRESWERDEVSIYGRFDFAFDGGLPKLLEYNADTPTSLVEAAIAQWYWLEERFPGRDQFNSLHERLIEAWKRASGYLPVGTVYFLYQDTWEDHQTVAYLRDTADQAGLSTAQLALEDLGWNEASGEFVDLDGRPIRAAFKLYPWEFMWKDAYGPMLARQPRPCTFLEPAWKMLLSNKALLAILWELFPDSPYLLPAYLDGPRDLIAYVKKPILAREGANVEIHAPGLDLQASEQRDCYGAEGYIYQAYAPLPECDGFHPVIGGWIVDGEPAGMGIRESISPITDNGSCFVPHVIED